MSQEQPPAQFNRPPRFYLSDIPDVEIIIPAPPVQLAPPSQNLLVMLLPMLGVAVMALFFISRTASGGGGVWLTVMFLMLIGVTLVGSILANRLRRNDQKRRAMADQRQYAQLLARKQARLQAAHDAYRAVLQRGFRQPDALLDVVLSREGGIWDRRPQDSDFGVGRLGVGRLPSPVRITGPDPDRANPALEKAQALMDAYRTLDDVPVTTALIKETPFGIYGSRVDALPLLRAMLAGLAVAHTPQDLHIHLFSSPDHMADWQWLSWLPHVSRVQQSLNPDLLAFSGSDTRNLAGYLSQMLDARRGTDPDNLLLVIFDGDYQVKHETVYNAILQDGPSMGVAAITLASSFAALPGLCQRVIEAQADGRFALTHTRQEQAHTIQGQLDRLSSANAEHIARALAGLQTAAPQQRDRIPSDVDLLDMYNVRRVEALTSGIHKRWARPIPDGVLPFPVPIGRESLAAETWLALDDEHHGPHGVLAGTTGSGKSELLQTLVCALALEHDPRLLNLLLIDFKGGSTFNAFADLPHTVGMVTNLDGVLVQRVLEALKAETRHRQQFLKQMNSRDITQYHRFHSSPGQMADPDYHPLPHLFVIVDEFAQLAREMPDFLSELVRTAQMGRSLGLHLILGTQSPMDVITDEMNDNLQFRICLRVQNVEASRAMLRRPDAAYLPTGQPGRGFFQVGEQSVFRQFQTAYVGGDYVPVDEATIGTDRLLEVVADFSGSMASNQTTLSLVTDTNTASHSHDKQPVAAPQTTAHAIVATINAYCHENSIPASHPILLPPLPERIDLATAHAGLHGGWDGAFWTPAYNHQGPTDIGAPIGMVDDVFQRRQYPLWLHFPAARSMQSPDQRSGGGHLLVTGGVSSGKTTLIRTLLLSMARLHTPDALHITMVSMMGGGLNDLDGLPHAAQVIHGTQSERIRRLFARLLDTLDRRQDAPPDRMPVILLVIDPFESFRDAYYEQHMPALQRLISEGHGAGIYVVLAANSISILPDRLRSLMPQRIALALSSPADYAVTVGPLTDKQGGDLPPGRGYIPGNPPLTCQICLPGDADLQATIHAMQRGAAEGGLAGPLPLRELPKHIDLADLSQLDAPPITTTLGLCDDDLLNPFVLNWAEQHFLVVGPAGVGRSSLLQTAAIAAAERYSPQDVRFLLVDFTERDFRELGKLKHTLAVIRDAESLRNQLGWLRAEMATNIPQKTVILIDGYDLISESLAQQPDLLPALRDIVRLSGKGHAGGAVHIWAAGYFERIGDPLLRHLLLSASVFGMGNRDSLYRVHLRPTHLAADHMPPGRAFFARHSQIQVVQTAIVSDVNAAVDAVNQAWADVPSAAWQAANPAEGDAVVGAGGSRRTFEDITIDTAGLIEDLLGPEGGANDA